MRNLTKRLTAPTRKLSRLLGVTMKEEKADSMYVYKMVNISLEPPPDELNPIRKPNIVTAANRWAAMGWRTVGIIPSQGPGYADSILVEKWEK